MKTPPHRAAIIILALFLLVNAGFYSHLLSSFPSSPIFAGTQTELVPIPGTRMLTMRQFAADYQPSVAQRIAHCIAVGSFVIAMLGLSVLSAIIVRLVEGRDGE